MASNRDSFSSKFGVIAAAAGSAIGLGNIWKFPYIAGENGGGVFLVVYLIFIAMIGIPVMMSEFIVGRKAKMNVFGAFKSLTKQRRWRIIGVMGVLAAFFIYSFYGTVASWTIQFFILALKNSFANQSSEHISHLFEAFSTSTWRPVLYQFIFMGLTAAIVIGGIQKGIEKYTKILMPLLLLIIVYLDIKAVSLSGGMQGVRFLFNPDFSKLSPTLFIDALGHSFFTLSLGMGVLMTYASYFQKDTNLTITSISVAGADTLIALMAGVAIFPAVFAFNMEPSAGPGLVFITLPNIFDQIPGGYVFSILFFLLLTVAALTSSISILEVVVAYLSEEKALSRTKATLYASGAIFVLGILCTLSFGPLKDFLIAGKNIFDLLDFAASNVLLPLGGMFISIFVGWKLERQVALDELSNYGNLRIILFDVFLILIRYVAPAAIFIVFLHGVGILKI